MSDCSQWFLGGDQWLLRCTRSLLLHPHRVKPRRLFAGCTCKPQQCTRATYWQITAEFPFLVSTHRVLERQKISNSELQSSLRISSSSTKTTMNPPEFWKHSPESNSSFFRFLFSKKKTHPGVHHLWVEAQLKWYPGLLIHFQVFLFPKHFKKMQTYRRVMISLANRTGFSSQ